MDNSKRENDLMRPNYNNILTKNQSIYSPFVLNLQPKNLQEGLNSYMKDINYKGKKQD